MVAAAPGASSLRWSLPFATVAQAREWARGKVGEAARLAVNLVLSSEAATLRALLGGLPAR